MATSFEMSPIDKSPKNSNSCRPASSLKASWYRGLSYVDSSHFVAEGRLSNSLEKINLIKDVGVLDG